MSGKALTIKQNMMWNTAGNLVYLISQWLLSYFVVIILGYGEAGIFSLAMSLSATFYNVATFSMRNFQVSDVKGQFSDSSYIQSRYFCSVVAFLGCLCFLAFNRYESWTVWCTLAYMLFKLSEAVMDVYHGIMQRNMRMDYIGISFIIKGAAELFIFVITLWLTKNLFAALCGLTIGAVCSIFLFDIPVSRRLSDFSITKLDSRGVISVLKACVPIAIYGFLFNTSGQIPRIVIESMLGSKQLGFYTSVAMPVTIVQVSANFFFAPVVTPLALCFQNGQYRKFKCLIINIMLAIALVAVLGMLGFWALGDSVLTLMFGASIQPYVYLGLPLVLSGVLVATAWFVSSVITVCRRMDILLASSVVSFLLVLLGSHSAIDLCGLNGATYIYCIALLVFIGIGSLCLLFGFRRAKAKKSIGDE